MLPSWIASHRKSLRSCAKTLDESHAVVPDPARRPDQVHGGECVGMHAPGWSPWHCRRHAARRGCPDSTGTSPKLIWAEQGPPAHAGKAQAPEEQDEPARLHQGNSSSEGVDLCPIGEVNAGTRICRTLREPHDQANHATIKLTVLRVSDFPGEYAQFFRRPACPSAELLHVRITFRRVLAAFSCDKIDREECARPLLDIMTAGFDELVDVFTVAAISDARADNELVVRGYLCICTFADRTQGNAVSTLLQQIANPTAYRQRVPVNG